MTDSPYPIGMYNTFNRRVKMADRNKFEHMLELLVNEDKEAAEKIIPRDCGRKIQRYL